MSCSCRVAPMRSFIRGLAQVHKLDPSLSSSVRFAPDSGFVASRRVIAARSTRAFHGARELRQDAAAEAPTPPTDSRQASSVDSGSSKSLEGHSEVAKDDSASMPLKNSQAKSKTSNPRTTKAKAPKTAKLAKKPKKDAEGSEDSPENPPKKRKSRAKPEDATPTSPRKPKAFQSNKPKDNKIRDIADSIVARRVTDTPHEDEAPEKKKPTWLVQKEALAKKFPEGWSPHKRLSPDALAGIRALNAQFPDVYNVPTLSQHFKVSPENIRRILKSKWKPSQDEEEDREKRWHMRGKSIWEARAAIGIKPPKKWREMGVTRDAAFHARRQRGIKERKQDEEQEKEEYKRWREQYNKQHGIV